MAYTVFYIYFAVKFVNYVALFYRIAPVVVEMPVKAGSEKEVLEEMIHDSINKWVEDKGFLNADVTLKSLSDIVNTNTAYLSRYINSHYDQNFRSWINSLRINESMRLIENDPDLSLNEMGEMIGIPSRSTFYRQFQAVTGMTPYEYRRSLSEKTAGEK